MTFKILILSLAVLLFVASVVVVVEARDVKWTGKGDGYTWDDPQNWDTKSNPTINDDVTVIFDETDELYLINISAAVKTLHLVQVQLYIYVQLNVTGTVTGDSESQLEVLGPVPSKFGDVSIGSVLVGGNNVNRAIVSSLVADHVYVFNASSLNISGSASYTQTLILSGGTISGTGSASIKSYSFSVLSGGPNAKASRKLPKKVVDTLTRKFKSTSSSSTGAPIFPAVVSGVDITSSSFYVTKADNEVLFINGGSLNVDDGNDMI